MRNILAFLFALTACAAPEPTAATSQTVGEACSSDGDCAPADYCDVLGDSTCKRRGGDTDFDPCHGDYAGTSAPCVEGRYCGPCVWEWCAEPFACLMSGDYCDGAGIAPPEACVDPICAPVYTDCADGGAP